MPPMNATGEKSMGEVGMKGMKSGSTSSDARSGSEVPSFYQCSKFDGIFMAGDGEAGAMEQPPKHDKVPKEKKHGLRGRNSGGGKRVSGVNLIIELLREVYVDFSNAVKKMQKNSKQSSTMESTLVDQADDLDDLMLDGEIMEDDLIEEFASS